MAPISTGAMAPPTIDMMRNDDALLVLLPVFLSASAKMVGNMIDSHRKQHSSPYHPAFPGSRITAAILATAPTAHAVSTYSETSRPVLLCIYDQLRTYARHYQNLFRDAAEISSFPAAIMKYHGILRNQIAQPLRKFCADDFTAEFAAEALLTWTMGGKEFEELYALISKVLRD